MKAILDQYAIKIKALEQENNVLRTEMMKAGIKIPLSAYTVTTGIATQTGTNQTGSSITSPSTGTLSGSVNQAPTPTTSGSVVSSGKESAIIAQYGTQIGGFINKIHTDWSAIQSAYKLQTGSYIGAYEFVKTTQNNQVFVDIMYSGTYTGVYDAKILYEYNTGTFQRKLIGFFEYDKKRGSYTTRTGTNPYAGVARNIIIDPYLSTVTVQNTNTPTVATGSSISVPTNTTATVTLADINKAYNEKRYLSTISLSNAYLQSNPATYDILRIRYRTFFIIGKYDESLKEIAKIETLGQLDKTVACDAQAIATYGVNQTLSATYAKLCTKK